MSIDLHGKDKQTLIGEAIEVSKANPNAYITISIDFGFAVANIHKRMNKTTPQDAKWGLYIRNGEVIEFTDRQKTNYHNWLLTCKD